MAKKAKKASKASKRARPRGTAKSAARKSAPGAVERTTRELHAETAAQHWQHQVTTLHQHARALMKELRKGGTRLPTAHRKALAAVGKDLRKAARAVKKLVGFKGK
ncbi:MAG: hypothetical protein KA175_15360 [Flavobacteriales bacterium]|nr:hypothetical protein [Flavobacteriales bacterium]MBP6698998.1 hypothetical protein [Flavobacteriales bacterium]